MASDSLRRELLDVQRTLGWMDLVLSSISDAVCVVDTAGTLLYANDAFAGLSGSPRILLLGQKITSAIKDLPLAEKIGSEPGILARAESLSGIYERQTDTDNAVYKVTARTIPTMQQAVFLLQEVTREQELDRLKDEFISLASHQLRTPLSAINIYSQMLHDGYAGNLETDQRKYTENIVKAAGRMQELVNNLLDAAKLTSSQQALNLQPVSLHKIVTGIIHDTEPHLSAKQLRLTFEEPQRLPRIASDPLRLREVFSNLLMNAVQYSLTSGTITVAIKRAGDELITSISDTGIGIPDDSHKKVFAPFYRAQNALPHFQSGTGLGLHFVRLIVRELNGRIWFESKEGKGTTFFVALPIKKAGKRRPSGQRQPASLPRNEP
jgi:signal transduction histidine kinase